MNIYQNCYIFGRYTIYKNAFDDFVQFIHYYHDVDAIFTP